MKILRFTKIVLISTCLVLMLSFTSNGKNPEQPNVLFLVVDDLNSWLLGDTNRYSGKVVAPNITGLAESGVLFTRSYTSSPFCSPSRTALLSGVSPWKSGVYENGMANNESQALKKATSFPQLFKRAGYGERIIETAAEDIGMSASHLWKCVQFYKKFPQNEFDDVENELPEGKNISWYKIYTKYLPESKSDEERERVKLERQENCNHEMARCVKCGKEFNI